MDEKIHRHFAAVHMPQGMQQPCFGPAAVQRTENVQHAAGAGAIHERPMSKQNEREWEKKLPLEKWIPKWNFDLRNGFQPSERAPHQKGLG